MDLSALFHLSYGIYVVSSQNERRMAGCIANCCIQVTSEEPCLLVSLNKENVTTDVILKSGKYGVSVLTEKAEMDLISLFGYHSSKETDKFSQTVYTHVQGVPIVTDKASAYMVCEVVNVFDANTHLLILGKVIAAKKLSQEPAMTYAYYHDVKKGRSPKKAPTYLEDAKPSHQEVWVCDVCGYEYVGNLSELNSYTCPVCGVSKEKFHKKE